MVIKRLVALFHSSLRFRLFIVLTVLTAVIAIILTSFIIIYERDTYLHQLQQEGRLLASFLASDLQLPLYAENSEEIAGCVSTLMSYRIVDAIRVRNSRGGDSC